MPIPIKPGTVLIHNAVIMTAAGKTYKKGSLLMRNGKIATVSPGSIESVPAGALVIDAKGRYLTPGLIDTHSHLGVYASPRIRAHADGNEASSPNTAEVRAVDSIWPQDPGFGRALAGGVTALQILPGSANIIGGQGVTIKMHRGVSAESMRFPGAPTGLKMACGENPKRVHGRQGKPRTRMGSMAAWRGFFLKAARYRKRLHAYHRALKKGEDPPERPRRNPVLETLVAALDGRILVHVHCYRADEMVRVLELADEFKFRVRSFHHAVEAYKIRDLLAKWKVAVSTWVDWWGFKMEAHDAIPYNAGLLAQSGARAVIHSDSAVDAQRLNQEAARAYFAAKAAGLRVSEDQALQWITLNAAWALGVSHLTGSLEKGKMADVVLWSGHPFSVYSRADLVFVDGVPEYKRGAHSKPWSDFEIRGGERR